jgi:hypothetical protein
MRFGRKAMICAAALGGLGTASVVYAQKRCEHYGQWKLVNGNYVCSGNYTSSHCIWYDDCRVYVD